MSFESPDVEKEFPGLYASQGLEHELSEEEDRSSKKRDSKSRDKKRDRKDKGYRMFEEEDSEEELVVDDTRSPSKMKKHSKTSFKFYKPKDKDKDGQKEKEEKKKEDKEAKREKLPKSKKLKPGSISKHYAKEGAPGPIDIKPIFGVPLSVATERSRCHDSVQLPAIFRECIDYIEEFGLACEGIYRISGVKSKVQQLKEGYNYGRHVYLHEHEPSIVASLLKQYLRELPEPVLTAELVPKFEQASTLKNVKQKVEQFQQLIEQLPTPNRLLLSWTIIHMTHVIAKESQNKMSLQNVSIVLSPTMQISHRVLNVFFTYSKILFEDVVIKKYVPPLRPVSSRWSLELPDSPTAIEEELHKQESLLNQLHEDVRKVKDSTEMEEQLWEVQRVVTQLKRKLKLVRKAQEAAKAAEKRDAELREEKLKQQQQQQQQQQQTTEVLEGETKEAESAQQPQSPSQRDPPTIQQPPKGPTQTQVPTQGQPQVQVVIQGQPQAQIEVQGQPQAQIEVQGQPQAQIEVQGQPQAQIEVQGQPQAQIEVQGQPQAQIEVKGQPQTQIEVQGQPQAQTAVQGQPQVQILVQRQPQVQTAVQGQPEVQIPISGQSQVQGATVERQAQAPGQPEADVGQVPKPLPAQVQPAPISLPETQPQEQLQPPSQPLPQQTQPLQEPPAPQTTGTDPAVLPPAAAGPPQTAPKPQQQLMPHQGPVPKLQSPLQPQKLHDNQQQAAMPSVAEEMVKVRPGGDLMEVKTEQEAGVTFEMGGEELTLARDEADAGPYSGEAAVTDRVGELSLTDKQEKLHITTIEIVDRMGLPAIETTASSMNEEDETSDISSDASSSSLVSSPDEEEDEELKALLLEDTKLKLEEEELSAIGDELRQKIDTERCEIERLRQEITELQEIRDGLYEDDYSSSDSSDSSEDEEELQDVLQTLIKENKDLEVQNAELCVKVHQERQFCLDAKVQIRMIQLRQAETERS